MGCQGSKPATASKPVKEEAAGTTLLQEPVAESKTLRFEESAAVAPGVHELAEETPVDEPVATCTAEVNKAEDAAPAPCDAIPNKANETCTAPSIVEAAQTDGPLEKVAEGGLGDDWKPDEQGSADTRDPFEVAEASKPSSSQEMTTNLIKLEQPAGVKPEEDCTGENPLAAETPAEAEPSAVGAPENYLAAEADIPAEADVATVDFKADVEQPSCFSCLQYCQSTEAETELVVVKD